MTSPNTSHSNSTLQVLPANLCESQLMEIYLLPFVFVCMYIILGALGNAVTIYIYAFRWPKTKTRIYILGLGTINFLNSVFNMPIEAYILWHPLQFDQNVLCKITRGLTFVFNNTCACVFVTIAIDRVILVYRPLLRTLLTTAYARNGCLISVVIGLCTGWPGFVFYGTATFGEKLDDVIAMGKTCYIADEYLKKLTWPSTFNKILFSLMLFIFVLLLSLYIAVGKKIYHVTKSDSHVDMGARKRFTKGMLAIRAVFRMKTVQNISSVETKAAEESTQSGSKHDVSELNPQGMQRSVTFTDVTAQMQQDPEVTLDTMHERKASQQKVTFRLSRRISTANAGAWRDNTISMTMITVAFIACYLPYLIIVSLRYVNSDFYLQLDSRSKIAYHIFLRTYFLNSAINPFIYSFVNCEFRRTFSAFVISLFKKARDKLPNLQRPSSTFV